MNNNFCKPSSIALEEAIKVLEAYDKEIQRLESQLSATLLLRKSLSDCVDLTVTNGLKVIEI